MSDALMLAARVLANPDMLHKEQSQSSRQTLMTLLEYLAVNMRAADDRSMCSVALAVHLLSSLSTSLLLPGMCETLITQSAIVSPVLPGRPLPTLAELFPGPLWGMHDDNHSAYRSVHDSETRDRPGHPLLLVACDFLLLHQSECEALLVSKSLLHPFHVSVIGCAIRCMTSSLARIESLSSLRILSKMFRELRSGIPQMCVDLALCITIAVGRSVEMGSQEMLNEFDACDGYSQLAGTAVWLDKELVNDDPSETIRFVTVLERLLYIGSEVAGQVGNPKAFRVLLWVVGEVRCPAMISACWDLIGKVLEASYPQLQEVEPFRLLFESFDVISLAQRKVVLKTLRQCLLSSNLFVSELTAFVSVIQSSSPSSMLIVCDFLRSLLADKIIHAHLLLPVRLTATLLQLVVPSHQLPCASILAMSPGELQLCSAIRVGGDWIDESEEALEESYSVNTSALSAQVATILECISRRVLALLWELVAHDSVSFGEFLNQGGLKRLLSLASESVALRPDVFVILVGLLANDPSLRKDVVPNLMEMLRDAGGTASIDPTLLHLRTQVLDTMTSIFEIDPDSRVLFREQGGFTWVFAVLSGVGRALQEQPALERDAPFKFVVRLFDMLAACLLGCPSNQAHLRNVVGISTLSDVLLSTGFFGNNHFTGKLVHALIKVAVEGVWPVSESSTTSIVLRNPEIIYATVAIIAHHGNALEANVVLSALQELRRLVNRCNELHLLASKPIVAILLSRYGEKLPLLNQAMQQVIVDLICRLASHHANLALVKQFFQTLVPLAAHAPIFEQLCNRIVSSSIRPKSSMCFPWNSPAFMDFAIVAPGAEWPPQQGFSLAFWIRIADVRPAGDSSVHICTFSPPLNKKAHNYISLTVNDEGRLCLWSSTSDCHIFEPSLSDDKSSWHHVVVSHAPSGGALASKKKRVSGICKLILNGMPQALGALDYGPSGKSGGGSGTGVDSETAVVNMRFGNQSPGSSLWFLENFLVLRGALPDAQLLEMYWGQSGGPNVDYFADSIFASKRWLLLSTNVSRVCLTVYTFFKDEAMVSFLAPTMIPPATSQNVSIRRHAPMSLALAMVGGVTSVLHVIRVCIDHSTVSLAAAIRMLGRILRVSKTNVDDFERSEGWAILAKILLRASPEIACTHPMLEAIWELTGHHYADGRPLSKNALLHIVLDWRIWCRGTESFQREYCIVFSGVVSSVSGFQLELLKGQQVIEKILALFDIVDESEAGLAAPPLASVVDLIFDGIVEPLMTHSSEENIGMLADFVLAEYDCAYLPPVKCELHKGGPSGRGGRTGDEWSGSDSASGASLQVTPQKVMPSLSPKSIRKRPTLDGSSTAQDVDAAMAAQESRRLAQGRCLQKLLGIVQESHLLEDVGRVEAHLPESFLVYLFRELPRPDLVLNILHMYGSMSEESWRHLAAAVVRMPSVDKRFIGVLFDILPQISNEGTSSVFSLRFCNSLHEPALHILLQSLTGCFVDMSLARVAIQKLHDAFLHNDAVRLQITSTVELCQIAVSAVVHATAAHDGGGNGDVRPFTLDNCEDDCVRLVRDVTLFLKEVILENLSVVTLLRVIKELVMVRGKLVSRLSFAHVIGHLLTAVLESVAHDVGVVIGELVRYGSIVAEAWTVYRAFLEDADANDRAMPWDEQILSQLVRLAPRIGEHAQGYHFLTCVGRLCLQMMASSSPSADLVLAQLSVSPLVVRILCGLPDIRTGMLKSLAVSPDRRHDRVKKILTAINVASEEVLDFISHGISFEADVDWAREWVKNLMENDFGAVVKRDPFPAMPSQLMERQLRLRKPVMVRRQSFSLRDAKAVRKWKYLERSLTHERGVWNAMVLKGSPTQWKLDNTEGPLRMRLRMVPKRVWAIQSIENPSLPASQSFLNAALMLELQEDESILYSCRCSVIHPYEKRPGEFILTTARTAFVDSDESTASNDLEGNFLRSRRRGNHVKQRRGKVELWADESIRDLQIRRYLLRDTALELFLINGFTFLIAFASRDDRDKIFQTLSSRNLPNRMAYDSDVILEGSILRASVTQKWQRGLISSFEYLQHLNTLAGRSYNDLTQYPVFPWIVADYVSDELDLTDAKSFRNLSQPMGAQVEKRLEGFVEKYEALMEMGQTPYHYGSHYSNVGVVLHYMVRVEPFASYFLQFQGGHFDVADRLFDTVNATWKMASQGSSSDVKECLPEFYYFPHFLINENGFDLGEKQTGETVNHVNLPTWAKGSARLFVRKMREALECEHVDRCLPAWIDLIFGYKQQGEEARKAHNLFHPFTYEGAVDLDKISDPVERTAAIAQINSYGQVPRQLFSKPHPARSSRPFVSEMLCDPNTIFATPLPGSFGREIESVVLLHDSAPLPLGPAELIVLPDATHTILWGEPDRTLRLSLLRDGRIVKEIAQISEEILCAHSANNGRVVAYGSLDCSVHVWKRHALAAVLFAHNGPVECVHVSEEWSIIVSGGGDECILWDTNRLCFIRSMETNGRVLHLAISGLNGDICAVSESSDSESSSLRLYSVNGKLITATVSTERITCILFSHGFVFSGTESGKLLVYDGFDLTLVAEKASTAGSSPLTCLTMDADGTFLVSGAKNGSMEQWTSSLTVGSVGAGFYNLGI